MKLVSSFTKHEAERVREVIALLLLRTGPCSVEKLFRLLYIFDVHCFQSTARSGTGLSYFAHMTGPIPVRLHRQLLLRVMKDKRRLRPRLLPSSLTMKTVGTEMMLTVTKGSWTDDYNEISPRMFGIMETIIRGMGKLPARHIDVGAVDRGAWMRALNRNDSHTIDWADMLDPNNPRTQEMLEDAKGYVARSRRLASLRAA